jgi:hypothetical protein
MKATHHIHLIINEIYSGPPRNILHVLTVIKSKCLLKNELRAVFVALAKQCFDSVSHN